MTLRTKVWGAFSLLILATAVVGAIGLTGMARAQRALREVAGPRWTLARASQDAVALIHSNLESRLTLFVVRARPRSRHCSRSRRRRASGSA